MDDVWGLGESSLVGMEDKIEDLLKEENHEFCYFDG